MANRDLADFVGGALNVGADLAFRNFLDRRNTETQALMQVATTMSDNGTLDSLPPDVWKKIQQNIGKDLGNALMYRSQLRKRQLGPRRRLQAGVRDFINRDVINLLPTRTEQFPLPMEEPPEGDPMLQGEQQFGTRQVPTGEPAIPLLGGQEQLAQMQADPQMAQALERFQAQRAAPTNMQRFLRADQLSPFGAALLTDSTALGQLSAIGAQQRGAQAELNYKYSKLAADRNEPTFGTIQEIVGPDGRMVKAWPMYTPNGGVQMLPLGEGKQADAMTRTIQQIQGVQRGLSQKGITSERHNELENRLDMLNKVFAKQLSQSGITVNMPGQPQPIRDADGNIIDWIFPNQGDKPMNRAMAEAYRNLNFGDNKQFATDRGVMTSGNLALTTLQRLRPMMSPENVGALGRVQRFTIATAQTLQGGPELYQSIKGILAGQAPDLQASVAVGESPAFRNRLNKALNSADLYIATINTLAAIQAKFVDPDSAIREEEFNRIVASLQGLGFSAAVSRISEVETNVRAKMAQTQTRLRNADQALRQFMGLPARPGDAPLDPARDIMIPGRIFPGVEMPGVTTPGILSPQRQGAVPTPPAQGQAEPRQAINFVRQQARAIGVADDQLTPQQWNDVGTQVNRFRANNPDLSDAAQAAAAQLIIRRYLEQQGAQ